MEKNALEKEIISEKRVNLNENGYDISRMDSQVLRDVIEYPTSRSPAESWGDSWGKSKGRPCRLIWP